jgi:hypothetical protein
MARDRGTTIPPLRLAAERVKIISRDSINEINGEEVGEKRRAQNSPSCSTI